MPYTSQMRRRKAADSLASDLARLGPKIAERLEERMAAVLEEGEEMPDVAHLLDVLGRMLALESEGLWRVARARRSEGSHLSDARKKLRDSAEPELRRRVIWVRDQMRGAYGAKETEKLLIFKGRTPREREALRDLAEHMVSFLPTTNPPKKRAGPPPNPASWAEYLRPALNEFNRYMNAINQHSDNQSDVVEAKNKALAIFDLNYSRIVRLSELFHELAGLDSLARYLEFQPWRSTGGRPKE